MSKEIPRDPKSNPPDLEGGSLADLGYRMPAEWEPHEGTWLSWPKKEDSWPGKFAPVPGIWAEMVRHLAEGETVNILVDDHEMDAAVRHFLKDQKADAGNVILHEIPTNDAWIRDYGPIFVKAPDRQVPLIAVDWTFHSWGEKYPPWELDDQAPIPIGEYLGVPVVEGGMVLEGGSIDVDGRGHLLTTEQCLLNKNRNPHLSREEIERRLSEMLGVKKVLWLGDGIEGDDTDGHIDDLTRFVAPGRLVTALEEDEKDSNYRVLRENREQLSDLRGKDGQSFEIIDLPMPPPVVHEGHRLPASYANFYIGNAVVLVPVFDDSDRDGRALGVLRECFPDRRVVGIRSVDLVWGLGAFHCVTQQQPAL